MLRLRRLIIGIDPGATVGIAIFDLDGNVVATASIRNLGMKKVIEEILKYGTPIVMATDVHFPPEFVTQIASNFNARLFVPEKDIQQREKEELLRERGLVKEIGDIHAKDAAAAAINFLRHYKNKMAWLEKNIAEKGLIDQKDEIKSYVLQGVPLNSVVNYLILKEKGRKIDEKDKQREPIFEELRKKKAKEIEYFNELLRSNAQLRSFLSVMSSENKLLKEKLNMLEHEIRVGISENRTLRAKEMQINRLKILLKRQMYEISRLEQSLKTLKENVEAREREGHLKRELEKEELERIIDAYREESK
ncbi:MAG: DUF460 domain-containing protein [Candidatus Micrarchaeia archaeon]